MKYLQLNLSIPNFLDYIRSIPEPLNMLWESIASLYIFALLTNLEDLKSELAPLRPAILDLDRGLLAGVGAP